VERLRAFIFDADNRNQCRLAIVNLVLNILLLALQLNNAISKRVDSIFDRYINNFSITHQ